MTTTPSTLADLGWSAELLRGVDLTSRPGLEPARVASVHAALVDLWTLAGPRLASLRSRAFRAGDDAAPGGIAVGDWVLVGPAGSQGEVVVEEILPRRTVFLRQAAGERPEPQAIAANVDRVFVVTAADADFNVRRLERYLVAIGAGGAEAQIVLTKVDLVADVTKLLAAAAALAPALATSAKSGEGIDELVARIPRGATAAVVGSSGVGKSALLNRLLGRAVQLEGEVRAYDGKGRHTTTRRQLFVLPGGGLLIDTPGIRELRPWLPDGPSGEIDEAFDDLASVASLCRYRDCLHAEEPGCAVRAGLDGGEVSRERFDAWQKLRKESVALSPRQALEAARADKRRARTLTVAGRKRTREKTRGGS